MSERENGAQRETPEGEKRRPEFERKGIEVAPRVANPPGTDPPSPVEPTESPSDGGGDGE